MTKKEFREAMKRGLGRCVQELDYAENPEKYREIVLWGCMHDLSFDTQCEGTRAWYLRELIRRFHDEKPFVDAVIRKLSGYRSNGGWEFSQYCELLALFAQEGNRQANAALWEKYEELYKILKKKKRRKNGTFPERDDFEALCIELVDAAEHPLDSYMKIAEDIGALLSENSLPDAVSFSWLFTHCEQTYGKTRVHKTLAGKAKHSPAVDRYFHEMSAWNDNILETTYRHPLPQTTEEMLKAFDEEQKREQEYGSPVRIWGLRIRAWIKRTGNTEILSILAQRYLSEQDSLKRAGLLRIFGKGCPFPLPPDDLIRDVESKEEALKEAAFYALGYVRHEKVRQFALELAERGGSAPEAVILLANHYQKEDRELFVRLVKSIPVAYDDKTGWHGAYSAVLDLLRTKGVRSTPKELLPYLYEHTLCSFCREYIVREMGRRHMITETFLQECLYDSNCEVRKYAEKRIKN